MRQTIRSQYSFTALVIMLAILLTASKTSAQTSSFTYQGRLTDGGTSANGNYDLQFALFDSLSGGAQVGSTQTLNTVAVSNGLFTVSLDFGANAFNGANRFLEISARPSGGGAFTLLSPRQPITSTPYAVRSLNAATADSVPASGVPAGSGNYIQNSSSPQTADFNISGNGTSNVVNATTQFNLNGSRVLSNPGINNLFAGIGSGQNNTGGKFNSFFGFNAGNANTSGAQNAFFGVGAGQKNTQGGFNSFFGQGAGSQNTQGSQNSFFGQAAGSQNTQGVQNSFFGSGAGAAITDGVGNTFIGSGAGNTTGTNAIGSNNTLLGAGTDVLSGVTNATAIGAGAQVTQSNSLVLGITGTFGTPTNVGIGTTAPTRLLHLKGPGSNGLGNGDVLVTGTGDVGAAITLESTGTGGHKFSWISTVNGTDPGGGALAAFDVTNTAYRMVINNTGNVGIGTTAPTATLSVNGTANKPNGGSWGVFSDERLKNIKGRFTPGLRAVMQLQPLRYEYKRDNPLNLKSEGEHVGFSAQAVQKVIPEAVTSTEQGYLLVNNDPILWTMLNAIKDQQSLIEQQQKQIVGLKKIVCRSHAKAAMCK